MRAFVVFFVILTLVAIVFAIAHATSSSTIPVSIFRVIAVPEEFAGQRVQLVGYLEPDPEPALYVSKDAERAGDAESSIGLVMLPNLDGTAAPIPLGHGFVTVEGTFRLPDMAS